MQFFDYLLQRFGENEPIMSNEIEFEDYSKPWIYKQLNTLVLQGKLIRFEKGDDIYIPQQDNYSIESFIDGSIMTIADAPWPGLTPDLLSIFLVVATQAKGSVLIHQKMFESRLFFVDKLIDMGAQIILPR